MNRLLFAMTCAAGLCAGAAPVYTVTLPNGTTNTLDEAFSNGYVTSDGDQESPSYDGLCTAADLRVAGGGRLEINKDLKSAGYTGEVHVVAGAILRITANGALGDTAHGTFVADGATLENESLDNDNNSTLDFANESLSFAGTGVDGLGALVARTPQKQERNGVWGGTKLTMTGDATISTVAGYQDFPNNSSNNSLNMNGFTLTVAGLDNEKGQGPGGVCLRPVITNPGHIVITNCGASINDAANLGGDANNTFTLAARSSLELYQITTPGKKKWTLRVPKSNGNVRALKSSSTGGIWDGPVRFEHDLLFFVDSQWNNRYFTNSTSLFGPVTIRGYLTITNDYAEPAPSTLTLASSENDIAGPVRLGAFGTLKLPVNGALSSCCTVQVDHAASVVLADDVTDYVLPRVEIVNDGTLASGGGGTWSAIEKNGAGALTYDSRLDIGDLTLNAGTVNMSDSWEFITGLWEGHKGYAYWSKDPYGDYTQADINKVKANTYCDKEDNCHSNQVVRSVRLAYEKETYSDKAIDETGKTVTANGYAVSYRGYIWNPDPSNVTWTFAASETSVSKLFINGNDVYGRQATAANNDILLGNATLKPGANDFWWRIGVAGKTVGPKDSVVHYPAWNGTTKLGLAYDRLGRKSEDPDDYERLDNSDGTLFTVLLPTSPEYAEKAMLRIERLSGVDGAVLNAPRRRLVVENLVGCPTVNFAASGLSFEGLEVTDRLTARVADLLAGKKLTVDGKLTLGDDAVIAFDGIGKQLKNGETYALVSATDGIVGVPKLATDGDANYKLTLSADGKTLSAEYQHPGLILLIK